MALSDTSYLQTLVKNSADAQSNLFEIVFTGHSQSALYNANTTNLSVRTNKFTPPATVHESYEVKYVTATIPRPKAMTKVTRNFTLDFRVDANYEIYTMLLKQFSRTFQPVLGFATNDIQAIQDRLFDVKVNVINEGVIDTNPTSETAFIFEDCWISNMTPIAFKTGSSDPATVTLTINFLRMKDPQTGL